MRETKYNWIEAINMMDQDPECYMSVGATYRIRDGVLQVYRGHEHGWSTSGEDVRNLCGYQFYKVLNPEPKWINCTWTEACALRAFAPREPHGAIRVNGNANWASDFCMDPTFKKYRWDMRADLYNKYFR